MVALLIACQNPFAPGLAAPGSGGGMLTDQKSVEGLFTNFSYSYKFKDTVVYGNMLAPEFMFIYRNYDKGIDVTWNRQEDMLATYGMFKSAQNIDLIWNEIVLQQGDSIRLDITRSFTMSIMFSQTDVLPVQGRASLRIERSDTLKPWKITVWRDESNY